MYIRRWCVIVDIECFSFTTQSVLFFFGRCVCACASDILVIACHMRRIKCLGRVRLPLCDRYAIHLHFLGWQSAASTCVTVCLSAGFGFVRSLLLHFAHLLFIALFGGALLVFWRSISLLVGVCSICLLGYLLNI